MKSSSTSDSSSIFNIENYISPGLPIELSKLVLAFSHSSLSKDDDKRIVELFCEILSSESNKLQWFERTYPIFFDLLMRKIEIESFLNRIEDLQLDQLDFSKIDARFILILLIERSSSCDHGKLTEFLKNSFYGIPFLYPKACKKKPEVNLEILEEPLMKNNFPLITSYSLKSTRQDAQDVLSEILGTKGGEFIRSEDFEESGELYFNTQYCDLKYIIADMHDLPDDPEEANKVNWSLAKNSVLTILHFTFSDLDDEILKAYLDKILESGQQKILFITYNMKKANKKYADLKKFIINDLEIPEEIIFGVITIQPGKAKKHIAEFYELLPRLEPPSEFSLLDLEKLKDSTQPEDENKFDPSFFEKCVAEASSDLESYKKSFNITIKKKNLKDLKLGRMNFFRQSSLDNKDEQAYKYERDCDLLELELKHSKSYSKLVQEFLPFLDPKNPHRIILAEKIIEKYQATFAQTIQQKIDSINQKIMSTSSSDRLAREELEEEIIALRNYTLSIEVLIQEYANVPRSRDPHEENIVENYIRRTLISGSAVNIVFGMTLKVGNELLKRIMSEDGDKIQKNCKVVSIVGFQSTAKSTLMNYLFGTDFTTSAGRCTKGLYFCLKKNSFDENLIVLDSEGLFTQSFRDNSFNNMVVASLLTVSHVMIINLKGEGDINKLLRNLLEICIVALKKLQLLQVVKPTIIFVMRDMTSQDKKIQERYIQMLKEDLEKTTRSMGIQLDDLLNFSTEDIFLFPNSFTMDQNEAGVNFLKINQIFSKKIVDLRSSIFSKLRDCDLCCYPDLKQFFKQFDHNWHQIEEEGENIIKLETPSQYRNRGKVFEKYLLIDRKAIGDFREEALLNFTIQNEQDYKKFIENLYDEVKQRTLDLIQKQILEDSELGECAVHLNLEEKFMTRLYWELKELIREYKKNHLGTFLQQEKMDLTEQIRRKAREINHNLNEIPAYRARQNSASATSKDELVLQNPNLLNFIADIEVLKIKEIKQRIAELEQKKTNLFQALCKSIEIQMKRLYLTLEFLTPKEVDLFERSRKRKSVYESEFPYMGVDESSQDESLPELEISRMNSSNSNGEIQVSDVAELYDLKLWLVPGTNDKSSKLNILTNNFQKFIDLMNNENPKSDSIEDISLWIIEKSLAAFKEMMRTVGRRTINESVFLKNMMTEAIIIYSEKSLKDMLYQIEQEEINIKKIVERERAYLEEMFKFTDEFQKGNKVASKICSEMIEHFSTYHVDKMESSISKRFETEFVFPYAESFNNFAYKSAFKGSKSDIICYIETPVKFVEDLLKTSYLHIMEILIVEPIFEIRDKLKSFLSKLSSDLQSQEVNSTKFILDEIHVGPDGRLRTPGDKDIAFKFELNCSVANVSFWQGYGEFITNDKALYKMIYEALSSKMLGYKSMSRKYVGCKQRCPCCGAKCVKDADFHFQHHAKNHIIMAFNGEEKKNIAVVKHCFDKDNFEQNGYREGKLTNFIKSEHQMWSDEFSVPEQYSEYVSVDQIPTEIKGAWALTHDYFQFIYQYKAEVPKDWMKYVDELKLNHAALKNKSWFEKVKKFLNIKSTK